jgi:hypothetical protein
MRDIIRLLNYLILEMQRRAFATSRRRRPAQVRRASFHAALRSGLNVAIWFTKH